MLAFLLLIMHQFETCYGFCQKKLSSSLMVKNSHLKINKWSRYDSNSNLYLYNTIYLSTEL